MPQKRSSQKNTESHGSSRAWDGKAAFDGAHVSVPTRTSAFLRETARNSCFHASRVRIACLSHAQRTARAAMKGASAPGVATQGTDHLLRPRKPREAGMHTAAFAFWGRWGRGSGQWAVKLDAATTWLSLVKIADAGFRERALEVLRRGATVSRPFGPSKFDSKRQVLSRMVGVGIAGRPTSLGRGPPLLILKVSVTVAVPCKPASPVGQPRPSSNPD